MAYFLVWFELTSLFILQYCTNVHVCLNVFVLFSFVGFFFFRAAVCFFWGNYGTLGNRLIKIPYTWDTQYSTVDGSKVGATKTQALWHEDGSFIYFLQYFVCMSILIFFRVSFFLLLLLCLKTYLNLQWNVFWTQRNFWKFFWTEFEGIDLFYT